jgi:hypothetical protein
MPSDLCSLAASQAVILDREECPDQRREGTDLWVCRSFSQVFLLLPLPTEASGQEALALEAREKRGFSWNYLLLRTVLGGTWR